MTRTHTWKHHIATEDLMHRLGLDAADFYVARRQLGWAGHVARMDSSRLPRRMLPRELSRRSRAGGTTRAIVFTRGSVAICEILHFEVQLSVARIVPDDAFPRCVYRGFMSYKKVVLGGDEVSRVLRGVWVATRVACALGGRRA